MFALGCKGESYILLEHLRTDTCTVSKNATDLTASLVSFTRTRIIFCRMIVVLISLGVVLVRIVTSSLMVLFWS